jgi:hypothetical protein
MSKSFEESEDLHRCALQLAGGELPAGWDVLPASTTCRVAFNPALQIYYKEYPPGSPLDAVRALFCGSRATRQRRRSNALLYVGIDAPESLAWGKLPGGGEYIFTRTASGEDVATWLRTLLAERTGDSLGARRLLLSTLGVFIGRVHATGFIPGSLQPSDVFAYRIEDRFQFTLVNNDRTVRKLPPPGRALLKNLTELNQLPASVLSRTDRMRFFVQWRRQMRELSPIEAKVIAAEAYRLAGELMASRGLA